MTKEKIVVFVLISICSLLVFPLFFRNSHNKTKQRLADNNKVLIQIDTPVKDKDSHIGGVLNAPPTNEHIKRPMNKDRQISDYSHKREFTSKIATKIFHLKKYSYLDASAVLKDKGKQQFLLLLRDSFDETFVLEIRYSDQTDICILNRDKKGFAVIKDYLFEFQILGVTDEGIFLKVDFGYAKK